METVVFDIDGTLNIICEERQTLIKKKYWDKFHRLSICADTNERIVGRLLAYHEDNYYIVILTSRPERWRESTIHWLQKNCIPFHDLMMRAFGDKRTTAYHKREALRMLKSEGKNIHKVYDDRQQVIDMCEAESINAVKVEGQRETR